MKVDYVSDLHINHYVPFTHHQEKWEKRTKEWTRKLFNNGTGEVLIVAGDFSEWNRQAFWFLEEASKHYEVVYYTVGNHDYYILSKNQKKKYKNSYNRVQELFEMTEELPNVISMQGNIETYKGVTFAGHSLWYELKYDSDIQWYKENSNDSRLIAILNSHEVLYKEALEWYHTIENVTVDVMISHVPPVNPPMNTRPYNACYVAPVPFLKGSHWVCGHQHVKGEFQKMDMNFYMNPIGYPQENQPLKVETFIV